MTYKAWFCRGGDDSACWCSRAHKQYHNTDELSCNLGSSKRYPRNEYQDIVRNTKYKVQNTEKGKQERKKVKLKGKKNNSDAKVFNVTVFPQLCFFLLAERCRFHCAMAVLVPYLQNLRLLILKLWSKQIDRALVYNTCPLIFKKHIHSETHERSKTSRFWLQ